VKESKMENGKKNIQVARLSRVLLYGTRTRDPHAVARCTDTQAYRRARVVRARILVGDPSSSFVAHTLPL